jgi:hypothetical protein
MAEPMMCQPGAQHPATDPEAQTIPTSGAASDAAIVFDLSRSRERALGRRLRQQIHNVIDGRSFFDKYSVTAFSMRVLLALAAIQDYFREEQPNDRAGLLDNLRSVLSELEDTEFQDPKIQSFFEETIATLRQTAY